jgi:hypothetical protein
MKHFINNQEHNKYVLEAYYPTFNQLIDDFSIIYNSERFATLWFSLLKENKHFYREPIIEEYFDEFLFGFLKWAKEFQSMGCKLPFSALSYRLRSKSDALDIIHIDMNQILTYHPEEGYFIGSVVSDRNLFCDRECVLVSLRSGRIIADKLEGDPTAIVNETFYLNKYFEELGCGSYMIEDYENKCRINVENDVLEQSGFRLSCGGFTELGTSFYYSIKDYGIEIVENGIPFYESEQFKAAALKYPSISEMKEWAC